MSAVFVGEALCQFVLNDLPTLLQHPNDRDRHRGVVGVGPRPRRVQPRRDKPFGTGYEKPLAETVADADAKQ